MMERISLIKDSALRPLLLSGAENMGYSRVMRTNCLDTPIFLYVNRDSRHLLIYNCGLKRDELILIDYRIPAKLKVIVDEYKHFSDPCHRDIVDVLEKILDGSFAREQTEIRYL
ncbi:hypothetical protein JCM14469_08830 [Desulfatiferula olefinivorans]